MLVVSLQLCGNPVGVQQLAGDPSVLTQHQIRLGQHIQQAFGRHAVGLAAGLAHGLRVGRLAAKHDGKARHTFRTDQGDLERMSIRQHVQCRDESCLDEVDLIDDIAMAMQGLAEIHGDERQPTGNERKLGGRQRGKDPVLYGGLVNEGHDCLQRQMAGRERALLSGGC